MGSGKTVILVIVSIFLVLSVLLSVALFSANSLLYPKIYIENLEASGTYDYLDEAVDNISSDLMEINFLDIPEEGIKSLIDGALTDGLAYLRGDIDEFSVLVSVDSYGLKSFIVSQMENFPVCSSGEISKDLEGDVICRPANESVSEFLDTMLIENGIDIPDSGDVDLVKIYGLQGNKIEEVRSGVGIYKMILYGSLILSLILIALVVFIPKDERKSLRVMGISFIISGLLIMISYLVATSLISSTSIQTEVFMDFVRGLINGVLSREIIYGFIVFGLGVAVLGISFAIPRKE
ncbi:MAG: hypothetical protein KKC96_00430 [Nanoarchaeota archaeon]|nr:hypothetical protein [Nanoarchaeota archaeon]